MAMTDPQTLLVMTVGAFVLGWLVAKISAFFGNRLSRDKERDPRDDRIRSLDAEVRIAKSEIEKVQESLAERDSELADTQRQLDDAGVHLAKQEDVIQRLKVDLRESVKKTRELRAELSERAEANLRSEVKLREVETELSVAQASTDLIATGVLDYTANQDGDAESDNDEGSGPRIQQSIS